jgi:uncharacterized protein (TIGR02246 family)
MSLASLEFEEVEQFTRAFEALFNAGDAAGMASYYAEDARLLAEHADLVRGRDAIERFWREAISRARAADAVRTIRLDEVTSSGDLGYALGIVVVRIPSGPDLTTSTPRSGSGTPTAGGGSRSTRPARTHRPGWTSHRRQQFGLRRIGPAKAPMVPGPTEPYCASPPKVLPLRMLPNSQTHAPPTLA